MDVCNPGNDGFDKDGDPIKVESYSTVTSGDSICVIETTKPGHAITEAQRVSMESHPSTKSSEIILVEGKKVISSTIAGGVPTNFDIFANIAQARKMSPLDFYNQVKNHGPWDYKQLSKDYQAFGNWNYGLTGRAAGWPGSILLRMAGYAQQRAGTSEPKWGSPLGGPPYGDDPADQTVITSGMNFYNQAF